IQIHNIRPAERAEAPPLQAPAPAPDTSPLDLPGAKLAVETLRRKASLLTHARRLARAMTGAAEPVHDPTARIEPVAHIEPEPPAAPPEPRAVPAWPKPRSAAAEKPAPRKIEAEIEDEEEDEPEGRRSRSASPRKQRRPRPASAWRARRSPSSSTA